MDRDEPWILGVSYSHNGAACLLRGDEIQVAIQEERLTGQKRARIHHHEESLAVRYCLQHAGLSLADLDLLVACHFSGPSAPPPALPGSTAPPRYLTVPHHLGHAHAVLATSGMRDAAVLIIDGQGGTVADLPPAERTSLRRGVVPGPVIESEVISLYRATPAGLSLLEKHTGAWLPGWAPETPATGERRSLLQFGSLGGMYSAVAALIFRDPMEAGKVMGLAPYGRPTIPVDSFFTIDEAGCFRYSDDLPPRFRDLEPWPQNQELFADLAASTQAALEWAVVHLAERARRLSGLNRLCYAGGVALNSITNEILHERLAFEDIYVMPAADDSGAAIGAAYFGLQALTGRRGGRRLGHDSVGRRYSSAEIDGAVAAAPCVTVLPCDDPLDAAVDRLCAGEIVGWFQGGSELGPRALGQRSILCDPRLADGKDLLNERVKHREGFRPFAPAILLEEAQDWFELPAGFPESPAMLRVCRFRPGRAERVPAAAHVDGTGRLQTVSEGTGGLFYHLLRRFHQRTGCPILVNTSFNIAGEPIVESPEDAIFCLLATEIDTLVLEGRVLQKAEAYRSILQLYPRLLAHQLRLTLPIRGGALIMEIGDGAEAAIRTSTPYGELTHPLRAADLHILRLCDGTRDGWQVLEALRRSRADYSEALLARRLCYYRRGHLLALEMTPRGHPGGSSQAPRGNAT